MISRHPQREVWERGRPARVKSDRDDAASEILTVPPLSKEGTQMPPLGKPVLSPSKEGPCAARGDFGALRLGEERSLVGSSWLLF